MSGFQPRTERQCRRATCPDKEDTMTLYVIRGDSVTAHSSAPAIISQGELVVQSIEDIEASGLSKVELTAIWNALPGTTKLAKFKDRKTAAQRLWAAFAELPVEVPGSTAARAGSKQAQVIDLFRRAEGATVAEVIAATGGHGTRIAWPKSAALGAGISGGSARCRSPRQPRRAPS